MIKYIYSAITPFWKNKNVDFRHLSLIADYMSFAGTIKAMNRTGMNVRIY